MNSVKVETKYNEKLLKDFLKFHYRKLTTLLLICGIIVAFAGTVLLFVDEYATGVVTCLLGLFIMFYPKLVTLFALANNKRMLNAEESYELDETSIHVRTTILGEEVAQQTIKYTALEKMVETQKYIYVYINKLSALIIIKENLKDKDYKNILKIVPKGMGV